MSPQRRESYRTAEIGVELGAKLWIPSLSMRVRRVLGVRPEPQLNNYF